jgi:hypothetical protein
MLRIVAHSKAPEYSFICQVLPSARPRRFPVARNTHPLCKWMPKHDQQVRQSELLWCLETMNGKFLREQIQQLNTQNLRG